MGFSVDARVQIFHVRAHMNYHPKDEVLSGEDTLPARPVRLLDQLTERCRVKHYSLRTERAYRDWVRRFILANGKRHPRDMGATEVEAFLSRLATESDVAASTQNQALSALLFLYREVLRIDLPWMESVVRAKRPQRVPTVLSRTEVTRLLAMLDGQVWLMAALLYGTGMRLMECMRLRVQDVGFDRGEITVRNGKGGKDRRVPLPQRLRERKASACRAASADWALSNCCFCAASCNCCWRTWAACAACARCSRLKARGSLLSCCKASPALSSAQAKSLVSKQL